MVVWPKALPAIFFYICPPTISSRSQDFSTNGYQARRALDTDAIKCAVRERVTARLLRVGFAPRQPPLQWFLTFSCLPSTAALKAISGLIAFKSKELIAQRILFIFEGQ